MEDLLKELEAKWIEVSGYEDIEAVRWTPGDPVVDACPEGCDVVDSGWQEMHADTLGVDGFRRTVFCREHGYARIYLITAAEAAEHGWEPPDA